MSRRDNEEGIIKIPAKYWSSLKRNLISESNKTQDNILGVSKQIYMYLKTQNKGKRGLVPEILLDDLLYNSDELKIDESKLKDEEKKYLNLHERDFGLNREKLTIDIKNLSDAESEVIESLLIKDCKFVKPKKQDLNYKNSRARTLEPTSESYIHINDEDKTITWKVYSSNHAVERARKSNLGKMLFKELHKIEFTSKTGGIIYGNDEFNIDDGDGLQYETESFQKLKRKPRLTR